MKKKLLQACYVPQMKAENMYNSYSGIKNRIFKEKKIFLKFLIFRKFWKNSFSWKILKFSKKFQKWPLQDFSNIATNKVTKNQPIWGIQRRLTFDNRQGGGQFDPPPCKIGLKCIYLHKFFCQSLGLAQLMKVKPLNVCFLH